MAAADLLRKAERPFIILGGGALAAGAPALAIAEATGAPILTTTAGKGAVPANHPLCWGYMLGRPDVQDLLQQSDCLLAAGTELSGTDFWASGLQLNNLIRIDLDPASLARPHHATLAIQADASAALAAIAQQLAIPSRKTHTAMPAALDNSPLRRMLTTVLAVIRDALPENTLVASDMTQIAYAANEIFPVSQARCWLHPVGFGTLGFALPAAIGASIGVKDKPVAALVGDYGLQYTLNELGTAVEHALPLPILLWNNEALGEIRDDMVRKAIQPNAVTLRNPDFQMLVRSYGARAEKPESLNALAKAIAAALKADGPTLIEMTSRMVDR